MHIEDSQVSFASSHCFAKARELQQDLQVWDNRDATRPQDAVAVSAAGRTRLDAGKDEVRDDTSLPADSRYYVLARLIEKLTGQEVRIYKPVKTHSRADAVLHEGGAGTGSAGQSEGWGLRFTSTETFTEQERTSVEAKGVVAVDGKEFSLSASLVMERSYTQTSSIDIRGGDALKDPLVINFDQGPVDLTGTPIKFDIDIDGMEEEMAFTGPASGFLVLDKNGNAVIDDGSELFGPSVGNGFSELAAYDSDKNGWIDETDPVYTRLRVWRQNNSLDTLQDLNIGAVYLGNTETPFTLKDSDNTTRAMIRQSGIYLKEDGTPGTIQRIDIAV